MAQHRAGRRGCGAQLTVLTPLPLSLRPWGAQTCNLQPLPPWAGPNPRWPHRAHPHPQRPLGLWAPGPLEHMAPGGLQVSCLGGWWEVPCSQVQGLGW